MSYQYNPATAPSGTTTPTSSAYPYNTYTATQYTYQAPAGYQWPYQYAGYTAANTASAARPTQAVSQQTMSTAPQAVPKSTTFNAYTPAYVNREPASYSRGRGRSNAKGLFTKELKNLMYGFGDDRNPASDTVNVMEEILIEYITDVCQVAGGQAKKSRLSIEDLRRALSRPADASKLARLEELLFMQEDIKRARAQFDESENPTMKGF